MQNAVRIQTRVLPGHRIELSAPELPEGDVVEVIVLLARAIPDTPAVPRQSMHAYLKSVQNQPRLFDTPADADRYLQEERDSWER